MTRKAVIAILVILALGAIVPAQAEDQTVTASLSSSVSMSTAPTATISGWSLASSGTNTTSGGTIEVAANAPYKVTVAADKTRMSEWDGTAYVTSGKTLTAPLSVQLTATSGTGVAVGAVTASTTAQNVATGVGLGSDTYSVTLSQATALTDPALTGGKTYRILLTYTASSTL